MKGKIQDFYIGIILLLGVFVISCTSTNTRVNYDSDEEVRNHMGNLKTNYIPKKEEEVKQHKSIINYKESIKKCLGENNQYLQEEIKEKKQEVLEILKEIYADSKYSKTYPATCNVCSKSVEITYHKFYQMVKKYNTGWTEWESYKWFLWWTWDHRTNSFEFHKCPDCILQEDINSFQQNIYENINEIVKTEAKLVKERLALIKAEENLQEIKDSYKVALKLSNKNMELKEVVAQKEQEVEELKNKQAEQEKLYQEQQKQEKINMAKQMLSYMDINLVMQITGLSREEVECIAKP